MDTSSASTSTSNAVNPNSNHGYDIFINHRGTDTKKNFASHLYHRFLLYGYQVFLDQKELEEGDYFDSQIKAAIKSASVHVALFSPRYAESHWCLEELLLMLETGAAIIPVFYNVKPSELRWTEGQKGLYAQALHKHEQKQRYDPATLQQWRNALSRVAGITGFELEAYNGDEGELLEKVVECVLKRVKRLGLNVAKYPTGLDEKVREFENTVLLQQQQDTGKPHIVGIVGLGGAGKTTLAKELFNRKNSSYRSSCFLFDVINEENKGSLNSLQSKLLKSLTGLNKAIDNIDEGIEILKKHLSSFQVLVVLDDVDNVNQLDALLPIQTVLSSDSFILITSRDKAVLKSSGVEEKSIYKLNGLEAHHSRQLFCSHAFSQPYPLPGFESIVDEFIKACDGLPLSLKIFGALLYGKDDQSEWQDRLDSIQQILPSEIQLRLKITYDTLNEEEKQIFLDVACFFRGKNRDMALRLWNGSGWKGSLGFQNLHNKCLVELDWNNNIHMHDHLRDMGRDIAKDPNLKLPRRVFCSSQSIEDLLQQSHNEQVTTAVRGIMVAPTTELRPDRTSYGVNPFPAFPLYEDCFVSKMSEVPKMSWFKRSMTQLLTRLLNTRHRFLGVGLLDVEDGDMERILTRVQSPNVIWIRWYKCPFSSLPTWIPMQNLTYLEVGGRLLQTLWQGQSQAPLQLRELRIYAPLSSIPKSIGQLKHLEQIFIFSMQVNLEILPEEFCLLRSLKFLKLGLCSKLKSLPDSFGDLTNLEHLDLSQAENLERLPNSFGKLIRLKYLDLSRCSNLTISSETLGNIRTLQHLNLFWCEKIEVLPPQVAHQRSLAVLRLMCTNIKELPVALGDLSDLELLEIGSPDLHSLPPSLCKLKNLKRLEIHFCRKLKYLPDSLALLTELTDFTVVGCPLTELVFKRVEVQRETSADSSFQEFMPRLRRFSVSGAEISKISFGEGVCPNLQHLNVSYSEKLEKIEGLSGLPQLKKLWIVECSDLEELPGVELCRFLEKTIIRGSPKLRFKEEVVIQLMRQGSFCADQLLE